MRKMPLTQSKVTACLFVVTVLNFSLFKCPRGKTSRNTIVKRVSDHQFLSMLNQMVVKNY